MNTINNNNREYEVPYSHDLVIKHTENEPGCDKFRNYLLCGINPLFDTNVVKKNNKINTSVFKSTPAHFVGQMLYFEILHDMVKYFNACSVDNLIQILRSGSISERKTCNYVDDTMNESDQYFRAQLHNHKFYYDICLHCFNDDGCLCSHNNNVYMQEYKYDNMT
jgi:hypothetical protein